MPRRSNGTGTRDSRAVKGVGNDLTVEAFLAEENFVDENLLDALMLFQLYLAGDGVGVYAVVLFCHPFGVLC